MKKIIALRKPTKADLKFIKETANDILHISISDADAKKAFKEVGKHYNPDGADFYYELKDYFKD